MHFRDDFVLAYVGDHGVRRDPSQRGDTENCANRIRRALNSKAGERCQVLIEGAVVPEALLAATYAAMAGLDGITGAFVPLDHRTGVVGDGAFAAHFVEAIALARVLVVKGLDEQAGIVVRPAIAGVVNAPAVKFLWPAQAVQCGRLRSEEHTSELQS